MPVDTRRGGPSGPPLRRRAQPQLFKSAMPPADASGWLLARSTATTSSTSRNCSRPGISSSPIWNSTHRRRRPAGARTRPARAPRRPSASCDAPPRKGAPPVCHTRRLETRASAGASRRGGRQPGRVAVGWSHDVRGAGSGRCCTNRHWPARCPPTGSSPADAIRHWSAEGGHPIEDLTARTTSRVPTHLPGNRTARGVV